MEYSAAQLEDNRNRVLDGMADACRHAGRNIDDVRLVAISKFHTAEAIAALVRAGHLDFGENYIQEAMEKQNAIAGELPDIPVRWHATGHVQSRKAKDMVGRFSLIHTLDSAKLATVFSRLLDDQPVVGEKQAFLVQVNIGQEPQKSGVMPDEADQLFDQILSLPHLDIQGLMCLPPNCGEGEAARPYFVQLRELRDRLSTKFGVNLPHLSMGMSGDFVQAIEEGATLVRVGTDIFGARSYQP